MRRIYSLSLVLFIFAFAGLATAKDSPTAHLDFLVVRSTNGKPVRNASVVLHPVGKDGRQSSNGLQLKTDKDGHASMDGVPFGKVRIQALAPGLQTYGEDVEVNQAEHQFTIKMNPPKEQYSIYK
jgi:Carboxypeptidase regulatory-like domain